MVVFHPVSVAELGDAVPQTPWDLPLWSLKRQGDAGLGMPSPTCRLQASSRRSGCIPAEPYLPLKHPSNKGPCEPWQWRRKKPLLFSSFDRTAPSSFDRTTTEFMRPHGPDAGFARPYGADEGLNAGCLEPAPHGERCLVRVHRDIQIRVDLFQDRHMQRIR